MGQIKFKGKVVYQGPLADFQTHDGWNNSMAQYYPTISILYVVGSDEVVSKYIDVPEFTDPIYERSEFIVELDEAQCRDLNRIIQARIDKKEAETVRVHKTVRVVRGRKVPIGTVGEVFWMGQTKFGVSIGLRLIDGKKVFTALKNVEVENIDKAFETEVLGLGTKKS